MIVNMHHLAFIQRQIALLTFHKVISLQLKDLRFQLLFGSKQMRIIGHMKHSAKLYSPWIAINRIVFVYQNQHPAIDIFGKFCILFTSEDRAGAGVGVDEGNVCGRKLEMALLIAEIRYAVGKEDEVGGLVSGEW